MSLVGCKKFTVSRDSLVSRLAARLSRRKKLPTERGKLSDKESGFESSPNSPRAESALEQGHQHTSGSQELALRGAQEERISLDGFEFMKKLGSGGYGIVVLVQKKGGRDNNAHYALKMTSLNRAALVERDILPRLENVPYTLDLAYAFFDSRLNKAYLVLPFAVGKDLFVLAGPCTNGRKKPGYLRRMFHYNYIKYLYRVRIILAELCVAISHLHKLNIVYRDLKLENILVFGDGHIRLADFGLAKLFEEGESKQITGKTGTPDYMAPEVLQSSGTFSTNTTYSFEADLWGLGVIAYELIVGQLPFRGQEMAELEGAILSGLVEVPRTFLDEKFSKLTRMERALVLAALSFIKGLLKRSPQDRLSNEQIPQHVFFQDLDLAQIATGDHDDPPFDIRRIDAEREEDREIEQIPPAFVGLPSYSDKKSKSPGKSGFDSPAKFANYHYVRRTSGWYFSDLEGSQCEDSRADLPNNVGYDEEAELDYSSADQSSCIFIEDVPGLVEYEAILADDHSIDSDDLALVMPDHGTSCDSNGNVAFAATVADAGATEHQDGDADLDETVLRGDALGDGYEEDDLILLSPNSTDSAFDEASVEADAEAASPPMAASTPLKDEIELFPRVRVVPGVPSYYTSPPSYSPAQPGPSYSQSASRAMPNLLPVSSARRRLNLDVESTPEGRARFPVAPPSTPTTSAEQAPRRRRLELDPAPALVATGRRFNRRLGEISPARGTLQPPAGDASWASLSSVHQSCTPSRFERDSPMSPSPEKRAPVRLVQAEGNSSWVLPADEQAYESLSPLHQSCTPTRFERDSPLSPSPVKTRTTARKPASKRDSPAPSTSRADAAQAWASLSPGHQSCTPSRFERDTPLSPTLTFEESTVSELSTVSEEQPSLLSDVATLSGTSVTRSGRARGTLEHSTRSDASLSTSMVCNTSSSPVASPAASPVASPVVSSKRSWVSPAPSEPSSSRPRRRRAAAAISSPNLPPKKRRRFRCPTLSSPSAPAPAPERSLSQLGRDGTPVMVQAAGQPQHSPPQQRSPPQRLLRSGAGRR